MEVVGKVPRSDAAAVVESTSSIESAYRNNVSEHERETIAITIDMMNTKSFIEAARRLYSVQVKRKGYLVSQWQSGIG